MSIYNIRFYNDMGHLLTTPSYKDIPEDIRHFAYQKASMYLANATDLDNRGCMFYYVKPGYQDKWTYYYGSNKVIIHYDFGKFDSKTMKQI